MNVFFLDENPEICAQYHCDKHVVKMIVESAQMLSTAHHVLGTTQTKLYRKTHENHPSTKWVMECSGKYMYVFNLLVSLIKEWRYRFHQNDNKKHKTEELIQSLKNLPNGIRIGNMTQPPKVMDESIWKGTTVESYRNLYDTAKANMCTWKQPRNKPNWF